MVCSGGGTSGGLQWNGEGGVQCGSDVHCYLENIPHVAVMIIVTAEEEATRGRERHRGDTTNDGVLGVACQLSANTDVEKTARCVIRTRAESLAIREKPMETQKL